MSVSVTLSALRSEFSADPSNIGYGSFFENGENHRLVFLVNEISANSNTANSQVNVGMVFSINLQFCVVASEYSSLSQGTRDLWNAVITTAIQGLLVSQANIRGQISSIWSGTTTGANISSLYRRRCSRAEYLFGENATVNINEAVKARDGDF
ncbi:MAG TPA: hypothetical protein VI542_16330 [Candidatus Tectomicrobia bacterium]